MQKQTFNPNRTYCRTEIDEAFKIRKSLMQQDALKRGIAYDGVNLALYHDCYTGKMLRGGDRYDYEHIISAEAIFMHYRSTHSNEQIAEIVNHPDNVAVTLRIINQYKGKYDLHERLLSKPDKVAKYNIDVELATKNFVKAKNAIWNI